VAQEAVRRLVPKEDAPRDVPKSLKCTTLLKRVFLTFFSGSVGIPFIGSFGLWQEVTSSIIFVHVRILGKGRATRCQMATATFDVEALMAGTQVG